MLAGATLLDGVKPAEVLSAGAVVTVTTTTGSEDDDEVLTASDVVVEVDVADVDAEVELAETAEVEVDAAVLALAAVESPVADCVDVVEGVSEEAADVEMDAADALVVMVGSISVRDDRIGIESAGVDAATDVASELPPSCRLSTRRSGAAVTQSVDMF